ncbi:hypothetical protein BDQ17DRAFT_803851 [Cyathus striatus]|nr:hypothetical protein BDQ17DRAFT_803851 [Cyathus striatus]
MPIQFDFGLRGIMSRYTERRSSRASTTTVLPDYETSQRNRELPPIPVPQIPPLPPVPPLATYSAPPPAPLPRRGTVSGTRPPRYEPERSGQGSSLSAPPSVFPGAAVSLNDVIDISRETVRLQRARTLHSARSVPAIRTAASRSEEGGYNASQTTLSSSVTYSPLTPLRLDRSEPPAYVSIHYWALVLNSSLTGI